ncbi:E3 ubiquitin-protein ligase RING1-like [Apostasia shenzhenica]|uniref:E3 ubiquitin-protein ligase RING1-like n=1 Tax=Apostasia shenzhenica TaxID=1088818 RepID=A0A2I0BF31_9ASPA|nr:E3 ubiquitin-protein ligase RING1-like [Apostasia shenzhenica]
MGSGSSRLAEDGGRRSRASRRRGGLSTSCFGSFPNLSDEQIGKRIRSSRGITCTEEAVECPDQEAHSTCGGLSIHQAPKTTSANANNSVDVNREEECGMRKIDSGCSSSQTESFADRPSSLTGCLHCPFTFIPDKFGFPIRRSRNFRSSGDCIRTGYDGSSRILERTAAENNDDDLRGNVSMEAGSESSLRNPLDTENSGMIPRCRRNSPHGPLEGSMRFSRTLSVGRLRDRVVRRTTLSEGLLGALLLEERSLIRSNSQVLHQALANTSRNSFSTTINETPRMTHSNSAYRNDERRASETSQFRSASNHDLLERRSAFLERRRRIRSQVRALQRLGSRFENLSGHDRSCISSGQHRTGFCTCSSRRSTNINNDTSTSSSISRIVMLAEALFEVLDEIHQQSAVLSSSQSNSTIGSLPAPKEVVDGIPTKVYVRSKTQLEQELSQCYICLVEYEAGDLIRILPCQHEFHINCIDKWLKEIHRVCPVCRRNICGSEFSTSMKIN